MLKLCVEIGDSHARLIVLSVYMPVCGLCVLDGERMAALHHSDRRVRSPRLQCHVVLNEPDVSEEHPSLGSKSKPGKKMSCSWARHLFLLVFRPFGWRSYVLPKRQPVFDLHGVTTQKAVLANLMFRILVEVCCQKTSQGYWGELSLWTCTR